MKKMYKLTNPQKSIWYIEQFYPGTNINNIAGKVTINSDINAECLEKAINIAVQKNEGIRLQIDLINDEPEQYVQDYVPFCVNKYIINDSELNDKLTDFCHKPFKILNSPLYSFAIFKAPSSNGFFISIHHFVSDAWSMSLIISEIISIYSKLINKEEISTNSFPSYIDYITEENKYLESNRFVNDYSFWNELFSKKIDIDFTLDSTDTSTKALRKVFPLSKELTDNINAFCKDLKISPSAFILFALGIYQNKLTGKNNFNFSTPVLNRSNIKEKETMGMFINNIPFNFDVDENISFVDNIDLLSQKQFSYFRHQKYPQMALLSDLRKKFNFKSNLYEISFSYQNARTDHLEGKVSYSCDWMFSGHSTLPLILHIFDFDNEDTFNFLYDYKVFNYSEEDIDNIHKRLIYIIKQVMDDKDILIKNISICDKEDSDKILNCFNNTKVDYDKSKTIGELFDAAASESAEKAAVICDNKTITYHDLYEKSNQFAAYLNQNYNLASNSTIAVVLNRSIDLIIAILGIVKAGYSYLLIDPKLPEDRLKYMLEDSCSKYAITNMDIDFTNIINLNKINLSSYPDNYKNNDIKSSNYMYLLYTSGSTGIPKGAIISHKNFHNYFVGISKEVNYSKNKTVLSVASISFDVFGYEAWVTLLNGLTLVLTTDEEQFNFDSINKLIIDNNVNIMYATPSKLASMLDSSYANSSFKLLTDIGIGGESLTNSFIKNLKKISTANLYNMYGPTETTVGCSCKKINDENEIITIGKPLANTYMYILDKNLTLCPIGVKGEIYISGDGVSYGYHNRPELNKTSFIKDIFHKDLIMYKTGDIACWNKDGEIIFAGRADNQVKIRGHRIELGEIENALMKHKFIKKAIVIHSVHNGRDFICAYYTSDFRIKSYELKLFLAKKLPAYMIPSYFTQISGIPLTVNGKLDTKSLPSPFKKLSMENYKKPETELEEILCSSFEKALSVDNIGTEEDFSDLGLDSLSIMSIQSLLAKHNVKISIQSFYDYTTIKDLANASQQSGIESASEVDTTIVPYKHQIDKITVNPKKYSNILLTGCTGFLGIHILEKLLSKDANIYCIIRSSSLDNAKNRLISMFDFYFNGKYTNEFLFSKIHIVVGDIVFDSLGLKESVIEELGSKIDIVIHSAANVKHFGAYAELASLNVHGTDNIIDFCLKYNIPLNHISTTSVSGDFLPLPSTKETVEFCENNFYIGQNYSGNYYVKSKFIAESHVLKAIRDNNLKANIFRVGNLTASYTNGQLQYNFDTNLFFNRLKFILDNKVIYKSLLSQVFDMSPVDEVADSLVNIVFNYDIQDKIFHLFNPNQLNFEKLISILNQLQCSIEVIDDNDFDKKFSNVNDDSLTSLIMNEFNLYSKISTPLNIKTTCNITLKYLQKTNFSYQNIDCAYIEKILNYIKSIS